MDHPLGLAGHSDADVLTHAVCDAVLGALGEPDIGQRFPCSDPAYKNISSLILLERVVKLMAEKGYRLNNLDCLVIGEAPRINPAREEIIKIYSGIFGCLPGEIGVKGTTTEGLGFCGRQEGLAAWASVTIIKKKEGEN